jgi:hypothetical protein
MTVGYGDIYKLPERRFKIILEGFVAASIAKERSLYVKALRSKANALTDDESISIGLEMLESDEWDTGEDEMGNLIQYPSTPVTVDFLEKSHNEAGLDALVIPVSSKATLRRGYKGMAIVISWPTSASEKIATRNRTWRRSQWR